MTIEKMSLRASDTDGMARESTLLSPRFYTTDFDALDKMDVSAVRQEWDSYLRALSADSTWGDAEPAHKLVALRHQLLGSTPRGVELEATRTR